MINLRSDSGERVCSLVEGGHERFSATQGRKSNGASLESRTVAEDLSVTSPGYAVRGSWSQDDHAHRGEMVSHALAKLDKAVRE